MIWFMIKDLFKNCQQLYSFENYLVILTQEENLNWIHQLFFLTEEGELKFLEKITIDGYFGGLGNLGIISTYGYTNCVTQWTFMLENWLYKKINEEKRRIIIVW